MEKRQADVAGKQKLLAPAFVSGAEDESLVQIIAASGISPRLWRLYAYFWLICMVFPILSLGSVVRRPFFFAGGVAGLAIFVAVYSFAMWPYPLDRRNGALFGFRRSPFMPAAFSLFVLLLTTIYGSAFSWLFVGASAIAGLAYRMRPAFFVVSAMTLVTVGLDVALDGGLAKAAWLQIIPLALLVRGLGLDMIGLGRLSDALHQLHSARSELAKRAVTDERLRMARDLHDLLGRTLSAVVLKSELAGKIAEIDPLAAKREMHEVEEVARRSLRDFREAVDAYRQPALRSEIAGARDLLEAAGIEALINYDAAPLPPAIETVLAWVVREAVTNVVRHSRSRICSIRIGRSDGFATAEIRNEGALLEGAPGRIRGNGLRGLTERAEAIGGSLQSGPLSEPEGFQVTADIPLEAKR